MSVRAYRIIKKEIADQPSFNLWHDDELIDFFKDNGEYNESLNDNGGGEIEVSISALKKALKEFKWEKDDYRTDAIKEDIAFAKKMNDDWVLYDCF